MGIINREPCGKCHKIMAHFKKWFRCDKCGVWYCPSCMDRYCMLCKGPTKQVALS
ncbi:MAG: hypothetical protein ABIJ96_07135 [Elusimicrobiota bacterium]